MAGARIDPDGIVLDPGGTDIVAGSAGSYPSDPDVAFLQDRYMVVWGDHPAARAQLVDVNAQPIGSHFRVNPSTFGGNPKVTAGSGQFMVVWTDGSVPGYDMVYGSRVSPTGQVLDSSGILISPQSGFGRYAPDITWDGTVFLVTYEVDLFEVDPYGAVIGADGTVLVNETLITAGVNHSDYSASAGRASGGAVVVWEDSRYDAGDILATTFFDDGSSGPITGLSLSAPRQIFPDTAVSANGYMISFLSQTAHDSIVMIQRLDSDGTPVDPAPVEVHSGGSEIIRPAISGNDSVNLVVWENREENMIYGKRVSDAGAVLDASPIPLLPGNDPDVAEASGLFLVISSHEPVNHFRYPYVVRVRGSDGVVLDTPFTIGSSFSIDPRVAAISDRWLAVWERHPTHDDPTPFGQGAFIDLDGNADPDFYLSDGTQSLPDVAGATDRFLTVFEEGQAGNLRSDIFARRISEDGVFLDAGDVSLTNVINRQRLAVPAWIGDTFLVSWVDNRDDPLTQQPRGDLYAGRMDANGTVTDPNGFPYRNTVDPEIQPFSGGMDGTAILGGAVFRPESSLTAYRIGYRMVGTVPDIPTVTPTPNGLPPDAIPTLSSTGIVLILMVLGGLLLISRRGPGMEN